MIDKYNAFISYRHAELDSKIAAHVQKSLERFHIPDKIRKTTGKKRIERIFRDKDELPITSDLTETISGALENSDYLIVICSENTKESYWVKREIEYFLRSHSRDHVLTVLAGGEPQDVIPEALLTQERTFTDENGIEHTVQAPLEPLSCDYRLPMRKADKEELPRLASAIIGCSYDELMNRRRAYRIRRAALLATLLFSLMLALVVYYIDTNRKIQDSLDEAMTRRSIQLAHESMRLYDEGDRIEALHVALASVPEGYPDANVAPETIRALTDATNAYVSLNDLGVTHTWNYYMPGTVSSYTLNEEGTRLAAHDSEGNVYVWDTASHEVLMTFMAETFSNYNIGFVSEDVMVVVEGEGAVAYDVSKGEEMWTFSPGHVLWSHFAGMTDDSHCVLLDSSLGVYIVDINDGSYSEVCRIDGEESFYNSCVSLDGNKLGLILVDYDLDLYENIYTVCVVDLQNGTLTRGESTANVVSEIIFLSDGNMCYAEFDEYNSSFFYSDELEMYYDNYVTVKKSDASDLTVLWENSFYFLGYGSDLTLFEVGSEGGICCCSSSRCSMYDLYTGETAREFDAGSYIIDISDRDENGQPMLITKAGSLIFPGSYISNGALVYNDLPDNLVEAKVNEGIYACRSFSDCIMYFDAQVYDDNIELTGELPALNMFQGNFTVTDDQVILFDHDVNTDEYKIVIIDAQDNELIDEVTLDKSPEHPNSSFQYIGIYNNKAYVLRSGYQEFVLLEVDLEDPDVEEIDLSDEIETYLDNVAIYGPYICVHSKSSNSSTCAVFLYDLDNEELQMFDVGLEYYADNIPQCPPIYIEGADLIYAAYSQNELLIDVKTGDVTELSLPEDWTGIETALYEKDAEAVYISDQNHIIKIDKNGEELCSVSTGGRTVLGMQSFEQGNETILLTFYSDGTLVRYDLDLNVLGTSSVSRYANVSGLRSCMKYDEATGILYLQYGMLTDMVETQTWQEIASISNCLGYSSSADGFFVTYQDPDDGSTRLGFYHRYTTDDLIELGYEILEGTELPESHRADYGI